MKSTMIKTAGIVTLMAMSLNSYAAKTIATVNGKAITQEQYETFLKQRMANQPQNAPQQVNREAVIQEMVNREILHQEAKKQKLHKDKEIRALIEEQNKNLLIRALLERSPAAKPVAEDELKKTYQQEIAKREGTEYNARHILVKTEDEAKDVIKKLKSGKDFAELAKKISTGPSGKNGGDLGWFAANQMVPAFSQAVAKMKKGTYSSAPVQTQFGWHVIKLEDTRKLEPPKYEDVKNQIQGFIQQQNLQKYIMDLRNKAKIDIKK